MKRMLSRGKTPGSDVIPFQGITPNFQSFIFNSGQSAHNQSLKQTGRANATVGHFYCARVFRDSIVSQLAPSGSLALRYMKNWL